MRGLLTIALLLMAATIALFAQAPETKVSLIRENSAAKPGSSDTVGIRFEIPSGWHMYWVNPGDAGEPPRVQWSLPSGWAAGELQWPTPSRMVNAAGVDYGYEGEVTLLTPMRVGSSGGDLTANLRWLVCKDICVPQKSSAKTSIKVGPDSVDLAEKKAIAMAKAKLPDAMPASWKTSALQNSGQIILNFQPGIKVQQAIFFPADREVIDNSSLQKLSSMLRTTHLTMKKADSTTNITRLRGVLMVATAAGSNAYAVDVPLQ